MDERDLLRNVTNLHAAGLTMLSELIMQGDKPDWKSILEGYSRE